MLEEPKEDWTTGAEDDAPVPELEPEPEPEPEPEQESAVSSTFVHWVTSVLLVV
jgi:hypothetical protein